MKTGQPRKPIGEKYDKLEILRHLEDLHKRINEVFNTGPISFDRSDAAVGATGSRVVSTKAGTARIAAAGTSVTVTNSLVTTGSLIFSTLRSNDATAYVKNIVCSDGSFVIRLGAAATAEVEIGWLVTS